MNRGLRCMTRNIIFDRELVANKGEVFSSKAEKEYYVARFPIVKKFLTLEKSILYDC